MFYVYAIQNLEHRIYIGQTQDLDDRLRRHNAGQVKSTRSGRPWRCIKTQSFNTREESRYFEWQLKKSRGKRTKWLDT